MAWIITEDVFCNGADKGRMSRDFGEQSLPARFRMLDGDGEIYYYGNATEDCDFQPLHDFGTPNAGCVDIQYKEDGEWKSL